MNVFEDLIDDLKADNLLEANGIGTKAPVIVKADKDLETAAILKELAALEERGDPVTPDPAQSSNPDLNAAFPNIQMPDDKRDLFRKRAMEDVSSLQMVEHVISSIEREHMKIVPAAYDDLEVKKALHKFLQVSDLESPEHAESEYLLLQETECWNSAIAERDDRISVANIRRFCERSRPALSSQALMALARFYRNSPFSVEVRGKFDVVMTRLFSHDIEEEKRRLIFGREEMSGHIQILYANWSSIQIYSSEENAEEMTLAVSQFEDLVIEAESANSFDELLKVDFFEKLRRFKESTAELFYVPEVCGLGIECNVRVGNKYVELIQSEKAKTKTATVEQKYGYSYDQIISDAASKTLLLVNLLRAKHNVAEPEESGTSFDEVFPDKKVVSAEWATNKKISRLEIFGVNKWFMATAFLLIAISVGIYFWAENASGAQDGTVVAAEIDLGTSEIKEHLLAARGSDETFYGIVKPTWDAMSEDKQKAFLQDVLNYGRGKGYKRVNLLSSRGRTVGFGSEEKSEILKP